MNFAWLYPSEGPLPTGVRIVLVHNETGDLGRQRLAEAEKVLGAAVARAAAHALGPYELDEEARHQLGLAGVAVGREGEVPALSPSTWAELPAMMGWEDLCASLGAGEEIAGVALDPAQREAFVRFLTRNHERPDERLSAEQAARLARHFFFQEPIAVVIRYTPPRFAHS